MPNSTPLRRLSAAAIALPLAAALPGQAATISEVFQSGPAGEAVELTGVDDTQGATLAILNGSRFDANGFGQVLGLIHLAPGGGWDPVVLLADSPWPDTSVQATPVAGLDLGQSFHDRLLVVFNGPTSVQVGDNPLRDAAAEQRYDASAVTDWLAFGPAGLGSAYDTNYDVAGINATLGIDLLARTADRSAGQVFARTHEPGQAVDLNLTFVGDPDANGRFSVPGGWVYRTTPGVANVPLIDPVPEPATAAWLLAGGWLVARRRRRVV